MFKNHGTTKSGLLANGVILGVSLFIVAGANHAFFRNVLETFSATPSWIGHTVSLAVLLICVQVLVLAPMCFGRTLKPVLVLVLLVSSVTAYFMDSYNVIIDDEMIANVALTDFAESRDLLTFRLLVYLSLLGMLPSALVFLLPIAREAVGASLRSRAMLAGSALLVAMSVLFPSSGFYASFFREHKMLRYYANPTGPFYAVYKSGKRLLAREQGPPRAIGEDARRLPEDLDRELVIFVVGEAARADRFSLNGYARDTNPELAQRDVVSFSHMSACGTSTAISVPCMFSIYGRDEFSKSRVRSTENVLDVLDHAGVFVLWRDNNSDSKGVANRIRSDDYRSSETNTVCDEECRDEGMLVGLQELIDRQSSGDILIVLHQMGSHGPAYFRRYPREYAVFEPTCPTSQLDECTETEIGNSYDNSIRYTDHFLAKVIELLRANDDLFETTMVYVSDHGESLGESGLYLHGMPYFIAPDAQTHVAAILWAGRNNDDVDMAALRRLRDADFSQDQVFDTLLGLFEIESDVYDSKRDILKLAAPP